MNQPGLVLDIKRFSKSSLDLPRELNIRLQQTVSSSNHSNSSSWVGYIVDSGHQRDDIGALYYVVAVIFIYGLSIVMMIASHIRKNKQDNQLRTYLKEMAKLRKDDRREKVLSKISDIAIRRQQQEAKRRVQEKLTEAAADSEQESEACQPLVSRQAPEDNPDSIYLQAECGVSQGSGSPSLSDFPDSRKSPRSRSTSLHGADRRRGSEVRALSGQDSKAVRIQDRLSPGRNDQRYITSPAEGRSPDSSHIHLSPLYRCDQHPSVFRDVQVQGQSRRWSGLSLNSPDVRIHKTCQNNQPNVRNGSTELKPVLSQNCPVVINDDDAVL